MALAPGTTLGPYQIVSQLGSGGMGVVYQAHDRRLDRHVAITVRISDTGVRAICCALVAVGLSVGTVQAGQRAYLWQYSKTEGHTHLQPLRLRR